MPKGKEEETLKTSFKVSRKLWRDAHVRALDEGLEFQELVVKALEAYLKAKGGAR
jgi:hypothetical protein